MAGALVDTSYPHSDRALRLCRMLDNDCADVYPIRLWCWGLDTDRESGRFEADAKQLAQIVRFFGDAQKLLAAFLECEVIVPTGNPSEYRIKGWKINARFFKERARLKRLRKNAKSTRAKRVRERVQDANKTEHPSTPPSPSPKSGENARAEPQPVDRGSIGIGHPEIAFFEAEYHRLFGGPALTATERAMSGQIIRTCAEAKTRWQDLLAFYAAGFDFSGHTVDWLHKHLREVLNKRANPPKPKPAHPGDDSARVNAARDKLAQEHQPPSIPPEQTHSDAAQRAAKDAMAKILGGKHEP